MKLDIVSLQVVAALGSLLSGAIYLLPGIVGHRDGQSARWWGVGKLVIGVSTGATVSYAGPSALLVERVAHVMLVAGLLMCVHGIACFTGRRVPVAAAALLMIAAIAVVLIPIVDPQNARWAMGSAGLMRGVCLAAIAWMALGIARRERLVTAWIMAALFAIPAALLVAGAVVQIVAESHASLRFLARSAAAWLVALVIIIMTISHFILLLVANERAQRQLREQAYRDALTGALNRFGLERALKRLRGQVSLLLIDVDRFKALNDGQGHAAGDMVLRLLSNLAQHEVGEQGMLVRLGGDEFLCVLPGFRHEQAMALAARLSSRFDRALPATVNGPDYPTLSIGVAQGMVEDGFDRLTGDADAAMYAVKSQRRRACAA